MGHAMPVVADHHHDEIFATRTPDADPGRDLRSLVEEYEKRLIVAALGAASGRQSRAAAMLGVLPTTLHEKMKRLGINRRVEGELVPPGAQVVVLGADSPDEFRWRGRLAAGRTLEIKGQRGNVRAVPATGDVMEVVALKSGRSVATQLAINVLEHESGVVFSVFTTRAASPILSAGSVSSKLRADFELRVPVGVRLQVRLLAGNIEVAGLGTDVEASTLNGSVRVRGLSRAS